MSTKLALFIVYINQVLGTPESALFDRSCRLLGVASFALHRPNSFFRFYSHIQTLLDLVPFSVRSSTSPLWILSPAVSMAGAHRIRHI